MLKKIPVSQARLGMHLHKLEGAWLSHPFWKSRFVLDSAEELRLLKSSGVPEIWIDVALGLDVAEAAGALPRPLSPTDAPTFRGPAPVPPPPAAGMQRSLNEELKQAAAVCQKGRQAVVAMFNEARMGRSVDAEGCLPLVEEIAMSVHRNPGALVSLARLKTRDDYSYMHSVAVCALMVSLAQRLGHDEAACREAGAAGLLHDIGKALMPVEILNKPGKLTEPEFAVIRGHPESGHALLLEGKGATAATLDVVLRHHERMDGTGYPGRLAGEEISLLARMGAVCDVYDAVTSNRPYKAGWDPAESVARMASWKGHFDPAVFSAFVQSLGIYPVGSLVRLDSERLAVVMEQNLHNLVAPVVRVFYSLKTQLHVTPQRLDLAAAGCNDRIVGRQPRNQPGQPSFAHLDELWAEPEVLRRAAR
jgi:HD-GYP domain-containing protein (c-di-GMP phosphodiesterase class II)